MPTKEFQQFVDSHPLLGAIGNTPTVRLDLPLDIGSAELYAKLEFLNPGGSVKDRPVLKMLVEAVLDGDLTADKTILDATSGNAGISYAMIGAALGYKVALVMPENASEERKKRIVAHGAEIIYTDAMLGYDEALYEVKRRFEQEPETYFWCDQYGNQNNPLMHYESTAQEILDQGTWHHSLRGRCGHGRHHQRRRQAPQGGRSCHSGHRHQSARMAWR